MNKIVYMSIAWLGLGAFRGMQCYKNNISKKHFLYSQSLLHGITGAFFYIIPLFIPICMYNEIRRAECFLKGIPYTDLLNIDVSL